MLAYINFTPTDEEALKRRIAVTAAATSAAAAGAAKSAPSADADAEVDDCSFHGSDDEHDSDAEELTGFVSLLESFARQQQQRGGGSSPRRAASCAKSPKSEPATPTSAPKSPTRAMQAADVRREGRALRAVEESEELAKLLGFVPLPDL